MSEKPTLQEVVAEWDSKAEPFSDYNVASALRALLPEDCSLDVPDELLAEIMAFEFCENYNHEESGWGTYYGPMMAGQVTQQTLDYWAQRAGESTHPLLKHRYASLVWDFQRHVTDEPADAEMARITIDATIEIATRQLEEHVSRTFEKLRHALALALRMKDAERVGKVRDVIIAFEDSVAEDDKVGLWGYAHDYLLVHKKVPLTDQQKQKIVADLENRLDRLANPADGASSNPWAAKEAGVRLAKYYRAKGQQEDVRRVLRLYGGAFESLLEQADAMLASAWLRQVHQVYQEFGLTEEAEAILIRLRGLGPKANAEMKTMSHEMKISVEEMNKYVEAMTEGDMDTAFQRIAAHYVPGRQQTEDQLRELASSAPMTFLCTTQLVDHQGRPVASIGSLDDDLEGRAIHQISQNIGVSAIFLRQAMVGLVAKFEMTSGQIVEYLYHSPAFDATKRDIIESGIKAYLANDPVISVHLLIPQIEDGIRRLVELTGGNVLRPGRNGGLHLKTLDALLRDSRIVSVFGEDTAAYLRILLTDSRGINLRNDVCHGIIPGEALGMALADRVIHALLVLARVRDDAEAGQEEGNEP